VVTKLLYGSGLRIMVFLYIVPLVTLQGRGLRGTPGRNICLELRETGHDSSNIIPNFALKRVYVILLDSIENTFSNPPSPPLLKGDFYFDCSWVRQSAWAICSRSESMISEARSQFPLFTLKTVLLLLHVDRRTLLSNWFGLRYRASFSSFSICWAKPGRSLQKGFFQEQTQEHEPAEGDNEILRLIP